jgi:two-component system, chemotaxis family, chemotaxis protein CheY
MAEAGKRVLVVDDAALVRMYYRGALESHGFAVEEALNGLEALEKLSGTGFDLLVVDVNMPQMDGLTFVESVRAMPLPISATPVLITSTESGPQDFSAARTAGANYYLTKPVTPEQLAAFASLLCGVAP